MISDLRMAAPCRGLIPVQSQHNQHSSTSTTASQHQYTSLTTASPQHSSTSLTTVRTQCNQNTTTPHTPQRPGLWLCYRTVTQHNHTTQCTVTQPHYPVYGNTTTLPSAQVCGCVTVWLCYRMVTHVLPNGNTTVG